MDWIIEPERKIPVTSEVDVLVCGGGIAGVAAAVCAARIGVKVLLVERYGFLGGLVTGGLVITTPPWTTASTARLASGFARKESTRPCRSRAPR